MSLFLRIPLGLLIMAIGFHMIWKTMAYQEWTGRIEFAEEKIGPGGTSTFLKIIGALVCFVGIFVATNVISDVLSSLGGFLAGQR